MKTTVPFKVYLITAIISLIFIVSFAVCHTISGEKWIAEVLLSLGSGGVSSTIVALVIDKANTKIQESEERTLFNRITADFDVSCEELLTEFVVAAQEVYGIDNKRRTFAEWAGMLMADDYADRKILQEADYAIQQVTEVKNKANRLIQDRIIHLNNRYLDDDFIKVIKKIHNSCQRIEREHKRGKYKNCLEILSKEMIPALIEYKSDMSSYFEAPFNWDEE